MSTMRRQRFNVIGHIIEEDFVDSSVLGWSDSFGEAAGMVPGFVALQRYDLVQVFDRRIRNTVLSVPGFTESGGGVRI